MFKILSEGCVFLETKVTYTYAVPRTVVLPDGEILCCFHRTVGGGVNDMTPLLSYSSDNGITWSDPVLAYPELEGKKGFVITPRNMPDGRISFGGEGWEINEPGELWWSEEVGGMRENRLFWCISDDGRKMSQLNYITLPIYSGAEQPSGILVRRDGVYMFLHSCCLTVEAREPVITNQMVLLTSDDEGRSFSAKPVGKLDYPGTHAEAWIVELPDDRLMMCSWVTDGPDLIFLSDDKGGTFSNPIEMPFGGQTMSLTPLPDGRVLIPYNYRVPGENLGVRLAVVRPGIDSVEVLYDAQAWKAETSTKDGRGENFDNFTSYAFGEPQVSVMPDGTLLLVIWVDQPDGTGVRYVRLALD